MKANQFHFFIAQRSDSNNYKLDEFFLFNLLYNIINRYVDNPLIKCQYLHHTTSESFTQRDFSCVNQIYSWPSKSSVGLVFYDEYDVR